MRIDRVIDSGEKQRVSRLILEALTDWFGVTVKMGMYDDYDRTNMFYKAVGFKEFEVFPMLWDEANPCQIYIMALK